MNLPKQTAGNDNVAIFLLDIASEGNNLIGNSRFNTSTGWTLNGDWAISGGLLTYTYSSTATESAVYDITGIEDVSYILEYEVTQYTGSGSF